MNQPLKVLLGLCCLFVFMCSCKQNGLNVDVSGVAIEPIPTFRMEQDFFALNENNFDTQTELLKKKYGLFYEHYLMGFLNRKGSKDSLYKPITVSFLNDRDIKSAYRYVQNLYPDSKIELLGASVNEMAKRFKFHFPSRKIPNKLITCTSGWNYAFAYMDGCLVVSLDMYLGDTAIFYNMLRYPKYQTRKMNSEHILPDIARGWLLTEFDTSKAEHNLLYHSIFYGKLMYAQQALLPETADSLLIGYDTKQLNYCTTYEKKLWGYFAEKNRLFDTDLKVVRELTTEGPFTGAISKECPPRIAMWVGWQIVRSYMDKNPDVTLEQLMNERDAQKILSKSKYRP